MNAPSYSHDLLPCVRSLYRPFDSPLAIQIAKRRVEEEYAVVGTWEDTNITLTVLENYIPRYFAGATTIYPSKIAKYHISLAGLVSSSL